MATLEAGRFTKYLTSNTSSPYFDGDYYHDMRGGLSITYELNSAKTGYVLSIVHKVQGKQDVSGRDWSWNSVTVTSKVNGKQSGQFSGKPPISYQTIGTKNLGTSTYTVPLNSDGSCSCTITCSATDGNHTRSWAVKYTLPTVALKSSISNNSSTSNYIDFGSNVTFTISRPNTSTTHSLSYTIGNTTYNIGSGIGDSITYAFPRSLVSLFPNNLNVSIPVKCVNSNGMSSETTVYLHVPNSYVPTCSLAISDVGIVPTSWGIWLKSKSKLKGVISASGVAGSSITGYSASANGASYSNSTFTTDYLKNTGSQTIKANVADSRGRSKSDSKTINVVDYWTPTLSNFSVVRCNESGVEDNDGTYGKVKCGFSIAPCSNNNTRYLIVKYGDVSKTFTLDSFSGTVEDTEQLFSGLSTSSSHAFEFYVIDYFNPNGIKYNFSMPPSFVTISYLAGGKGVTIGQIATKEGFQIEMDAFYKGQPFLETEDVDEW